MKVSGIFKAINEQVLAVSYDEETEDALGKAIKDWTDAEYLTHFFEEHQADLQKGFWGSITVEDAVMRTIEEAQDLFDELYELAEEDEQKLNALFKPLHNQDYRTYELKKHKAYGQAPRSWLRLYAIRWEDTYVITGSAIKLTQTMEEREHTRLELRKLEMVRNFLKENQDEGEFGYLDL